MHVESLDARYLMAATGLDPTFGSNGRATLPAGFLATSLDSGEALEAGRAIVAGDGGAYFVGGTGPTAGQGTSFSLDQSIAKLKADGTLDLTFGKKGFAAVPGVAVQLAWDSTNHLLYVGSNGQTTNAGPDNIAHVTRLTADGSVDTTFGTNGTFSYTPTGNAQTGQATVEAINPLPDGSTVIAIERQFASDLNTSNSRQETQQSLTLFKLRRNGTRDPNYGSRGVTQLLSGAFDMPVNSPANSSSFTQAVSVGRFADVQTNRHCVTSVLIGYGTGTLTDNSEDDVYTSGEADQGTFYAKARTVSASGVDDPSKAYSWKLADTAGDGHYYHIASISQGSDGVHALLTSSTRPLHPSSAATGGRNVQNALLYTLQPGQRPTRQTIAPNGADPILAMTRAVDGSYFAYGKTTVRKLRRNFTTDHTFGLNGVATAAAGFANNSVLADDRGRFLADEFGSVDNGEDDFTLDRFA